MLTIGVAGHVDHGKTSLVRALTGIDTDRLAEEKRRGISIELGFAWLDLDVPTLGVQRVALVDMPGHERFVRRMIAGAAGIDAVLLVVAADEGAMPQGREHLAICNLLGLTTGAIALTKIDTVDAEMLQMASDDARQLVAGTFLHDAPVWPVSVRNPETVAQFKISLASFAAQLLQHRRDRGQAERPFLLAVDRAFSRLGRGTVVAGTAISGQVAAEQALEVLPSGQTFRVRGLQQQGEARPVVRAPGRVALNLAGAAVADAPIGSVLAAPGSVHVGHRFDAVLTTLAHAPELPLVAKLTLHMGTDFVDASVVQLSGQPQAPATQAWVQVHVDRAWPLPPGAAFVVRGSHDHGRNGRTLGGGRVLHPAPRRHRLGDATVLAACAQLHQGDTSEVLITLTALAGERGLPESEAIKWCPASAAAISRTIKALLAATTLRRLGQPARLLTPAACALIAQRVQQVTGELHRTAPSRPGLDAEALARAVGALVEPSVAVALAQQLVQRGQLGFDGQVYALPGFRPKTTVDGAVVDQLVAALQASGLAAPLHSELALALGTDAKAVTAAAHIAMGQGRLVRLADEMFVPVAAARAAADRVIAAFGERAAFATGDLKDLLGLTRKHLIPFAEWLDGEKVTVRDPAGNRRVRDKARAAWLERQAPAGPI